MVILLVRLLTVRYIPPRKYRGVKLCGNQSIVFSLLLLLNKLLPMVSRFTADHLHMTSQMVAIAVVPKRIRQITYGISLFMGQGILLLPMPMHHVVVITKKPGRRTNMTMIMHHPNSICSASFLKTRRKGRMITQV